MTKVETAAWPASALEWSCECGLGESFGSGKAQSLALLNPAERQPGVGHQFSRCQGRRLTAVQDRHNDVGREKVQAHQPRRIGRAKSARRFLDRWNAWVQISDLAPMKKLAKTVMGKAAKPSSISSPAMFSLIPRYEHEVTHSK